MKYQYVKNPGGILAPASEIEAERAKAIPNGTQLPVDYVKTRNYDFHKRVFAFFNFCFQYWSADLTDSRFQDEHAQFETFRKQLTILAGYYKETVNIRNHKIGYEARSLSYAENDEEQIHEIYSALINAALKHIFPGCKDKNVLNALMEFFPT